MVRFGVVWLGSGAPVVEVVAVMVVSVVMVVVVKVVVGVESGGGGIGMR
jgi:hypothetical protein